MFFLCSHTRESTVVYVKVSNPYCTGCLDHLIEYIEDRPKISKVTRYLLLTNYHSEYLILKDRFRTKYKVNTRIISSSSGRVSRSPVLLKAAPYSPEVVIMNSDEIQYFVNSICFDENMVISDTLLKSLEKISH